MQKWLVIVCFSWLSLAANAQEEFKIYTWDQVKNASPDTIFAISASKLKWETVPEKLFTFKSLKYLDISNNKLKELPAELGTLNKLVYLNVSKNKITGAPVVVCQLTQMKTLLLGRNQISSLPDCMGYLSDLRKLDLWDNPINVLPESIQKLDKLTAVDMRGILLTPAFQNQWREVLPNVTWYFDAPCHCVE